MSKAARRYHLTLALVVGVTLVLAGLAQSCAAPVDKDMAATHAAHVRRFVAQVDRILADADLRNDADIRRALALSGETLALGAEALAREAGPEGDPADNEPAGSEVP